MRVTNGWWTGFAILLAAAAVGALAGCGDDTDDGDADAADDGAEGDAADGDGDVVDDVPGDEGTDAEAGPPRRLTILHTNDMHAHVLGVGPEREYTPATTGDDGTVGGAARLATLIAERRAAAEAAGGEVIVTDSGDFSTGTLFSTIWTTHAPELTLMASLGYDAITLGNHEFEWGPQHLAAMVARAVALGFDVPIVASNMIPDGTDPRDDALEALVGDGTIASASTIVLPGGLTVGVIGWMGKGAASVAPAKAPVTFEEDMAEAQALAAGLRAAGADVVICLSHIGQYGGMGSSSDQELAEAAPDVDIIVGGHSHTVLTEAQMFGETIIVQAGGYMRYLGELTVEVSATGVLLTDYLLHPVDDTVAGDAAVQTMVDDWVEAIDTDVLAPLGLTYMTEVAETSFDLTTRGLAESNLGDLVTDVYREVAAAATPADPVVAAFESDGVIRDDILVGAEGILTVGDLFRVLPLGTGPDLQPGYPLVSFWVNGAELRTACEVSVSLATAAGGDYQIQISGLRCHRDPSGGFLSAIDAVYLGNDLDGYAATSIDVTGTDTALYRITVDSYVAGLMSSIEDLSYGMLSVTPKAADGTEIADMSSTLLDADPAATGLQELKLWRALLQWVAAQPDADGDTLPEIPARFATPAGRYYTD